MEYSNNQTQKKNTILSLFFPYAIWFGRSFSHCAHCVYLVVADCVRAGAGRRSQETEVGLQAGAGGGLHEPGELRTALPRAHWEETPSETEPCLSEDLSPPFFFFPHITWLPPSAFQRWLLPRPSFFFFFFFCFLQAEKIFLFNSSTLLHRLVLSEYTWRVVQGLRFGISHSAMQGIPQLHHGESFKGGLLESWPYWHSSVPLAGRKK